MGSVFATLGNSGSRLQDWLNVGQWDRNDTARALYVLTGVLTVLAVPKPSTLLLGAMARIGLMSRRRRLTTLIFAQQNGAQPNGPETITRGNSFPA